MGFGAKVLGPILQTLAWSSAPSGDDEMAELRSISAALASCSDTVHATRIADLRGRAYANAVAQLNAAADRAPEFQQLSEKRSLNTLDLDLMDNVAGARANALELIRQLKTTSVEQYHEKKAAKALTTFALKGPSVQGLIDFILQNFQYRYVSVYDYLHTYNQPGVRVVDLMLPSMVDYDFWLAKGTATKTSLAKQVEVMSQISVLTAGRVHGFAPFCPLRQVAFEAGNSATDSFSMVTDALNTKGCVGVKLYPPMGFAAYGNKDLKDKNGGPFWKQDWLPSWTADPALGQKLDDAMAKMLSWCEQHEVPVMAHTNLSNGPSTEFEALAGSDYWAKALNAFPKLRINFGHFGDTSPVEDGLTRAKAFMALMASDKSAVGGNAYADAGYFMEVISQQPAILADLRQLYETVPPAGRASLANRLMYGTDWEMTLIEGDVGSYLADFAKVFDELEARPAVQQQQLTGLSARFFAGNAADWAGLRRGEATRARLDAFYEANGVRSVDWRAKLG